MAVAPRPPSRLKCFVEGYLRLHIEEFLDAWECKRAPEAFLPASETDKVRRGDQLRQARKEYRWNYDFEGIPFLEGLPEGEKPRVRWIHAIAPVIIDLVRNATRVEAGVAMDFDLERYVKELARVVIRRLPSMEPENFQNAAASVSGGLFQHIVTGTTESHASGMDDYVKLFSEVIGRPSVVKPLLPGLPENFDLCSELNQDLLFAWYRVAGPNPMSIMEATPERMKDFAVTNEMMQALPQFEDDSLELAQSENRLYMVDYAHLKDLVDTGGKHLYAPKALFAVPKQGAKDLPLLPIAIQAGPDPDIFPVFTPKSHNISWLTAKTMVQVADAYTHEAMHHLGGCHFTMEIFLCSMRRSLAENHPIARLLAEHFTGTALINYLGVRALVSEGGTADRILAPSIEDTNQFIGDHVGDTNFLERIPEVDFKARGVMSSKLTYPYRDDALELFRIIENWVTGYLRSYYYSNNQVRDDKEVQQWMWELAEKGGIAGLPAKGELLQFKKLVEIVSLVIFIASAQHSAVNFPQWPMMGFCAAMPTAGYLPAPTLSNPFPWERDDADTSEPAYAAWISQVLPPLQHARSQLFVMKLLATMRFTKLGMYPKHTLDFSRPERRNAQRVFEQDLRKLENKIILRNRRERKRNLYPYTFLRPSYIPASTNI